MTRLSTFLIVLISLFVAIVGREEAHSLSNHEKEIPADILFEIEKRIDQLLSEKERNSDESLNRRRPKPSRLQSDYDDDEELPKRPTETKKTQSSCSSFFQTSENQIVRTKDSLENGAQFIEKYDITPDHPDQVLRVTCMQKCCETNSCDFALFAEKDLKSCYLFNCAGKCLFLDHVGYVSMYMNISQHEDELLGIGHRVSSTTSTTTTISTVTASPAAAPLVCGPIRNACADQSQCVPIYDVCDGVRHCADASDEMGCPEKNYDSGPQRPANIGFNSRPGGGGYPSDSRYGGNYDSDSRDSAAFDTLLRKLSALISSEDGAKPDAAAAVTTTTLAPSPSASSTTTSPKTSGQPDRHKQVNMAGKPAGEKTAGAGRVNSESGAAVPPAKNRYEPYYEYTDDAAGNDGSRDPSRNKNRGPGRLSQPSWWSTFDYGDDSTDDKDDVNKAKGKAPKPDPDTPHQVAIPGDPKARIDGHVAAPNGTGTSGIGGVIVHHVSDDGSISESEVVEISVSDNFWKAHYSRAALMALILGLILTLTMFVFITIRIVSSRRRMHLRKGRMTNGNEADYLINGMYL